MNEITIIVLAESDSQPFTLGNQIFLTCPDKSVEAVRSALGSRAELIAKVERLRAALQERCKYLGELQDVKTDISDEEERFLCPSCQREPVVEKHREDCRHARLMRFPEGV